MRAVCMSIGCSALLVAVGLAFSEGPVIAQGKSQQKDKGLSRALQMVPQKAQEKVLMAAQKGKHKGQTQQKGGHGKAKGKK